MPTAQAVRLHHGLGLHGIHRARMMVVQVDGELLPDCSALAGDRGLEQVVLNILRQAAPPPHHGAPERAAEVVGLLRRQPARGVPLLDAGRRAQGCERLGERLVLGPLPARREECLHADFARPAP